MREIKEPIYIYAKDSGELWKYKTIDFAEKAIEVYDFDNYDIFDGLYRKMMPYKKDKYNRVGFELSSDIKEERLKKHMIRELIERKIIQDESILDEKGIEKLTDMLPFEQL